MIDTLVIPHPCDGRQLAELVRRIEQTATLYPGAIRYEDALVVTVASEPARAALEQVVSAYGTPAC